MKKIIIILLLIPLLGFAQDIEYNNRRELTTNTELTPLIEQFVIDGQNRGYYLFDIILENTDTILFDDNLRDSDYGVRFKRNIAINSDIRNDEDLLIFTLYHELVHVILNSELHSCYDCIDIMSYYIPSDKDIKDIRKNWEFELDKLFIFLKDNYKK